MWKSATSARSRRPLTLNLLALATLGLGAWGSANAATFYVRADGGDATQCNGRADAAYPGSGTAQNCAWKSPSLALGSTPRIAGGDTLIVGAGSYSLSSSLVVPSGPDATLKTRILGKGHDTGCSVAPKLIGTNGIRMISLDGKSNVELGCFEVTDQADCVYNHTNSAANCTSTSAMGGKVGIFARASKNVNIHDVNVHGMAHIGMHAAGLTDWTLDRVKINYNGWVGWEGNHGSTGSSNSGKITMRNVEVAYNGCGQKWSTGAPWACWAQQTGGYGDGMGTTYTGGTWLIEDSYFHHNTSDGLDLRYLDGASTTSVTIRRVYAYANAGNQVKTRGNALVENSVIVGWCSAFQGKDYMQQADNCRANGGAISLVQAPGRTATLRHSTITGNGDTLVIYSEGDSASTVNLQNNVITGNPYFFNTGKLSTAVYGYNTTAKLNSSGNLVYNAGGSCPAGSTCGTHPKLTNMTLSAFDAEPMSGSPVIDKVPVLAGVTTDFVLAARPYGAASDIGAYEYGSTASGGGTVSPTPAPTPSPTCSRAAPTVSVSGATTAVAAGTTKTYTVTVRNNDATACAAKTFALAKTVPTGWTGVLPTSVSLAAGASTTATFSVTSPTTAAAGNYGLGVGVSSSEGPVHTASASATYSVAAPVVVAPTTCVRNKPSISLAKSVGSVRAGTAVNYTVTIKNNDNSLCTAKTFMLAETKPSGWYSTLVDSVKLNAGASTTVTLNIDSPSSAKVGTYGVGVGISSGAGSVHTNNASSTYVIY